MTKQIDDVYNEVKELRSEVHDFAQQVIANKNDLSWVKCSLKMGLTFILTILSGIILYLVKTNI